MPRSRAQTVPQAGPARARPHAPHLQPPSLHPATPHPWHHLWLLSPKLPCPGPEHGTAPGALRQPRGVTLPPCCTAPAGARWLQEPSGIAVPVGCSHRAVPDGRLLGRQKPSSSHSASRQFQGEARRWGELVPVTRGVLVQRGTRAGAGLLGVVPSPNDRGHAQTWGQDTRHSHLQHRQQGQSHGGELLHQQTGTAEIPNQPLHWQEVFVSLPLCSMSPL